MTDSQRWFMALWIFILGALVYLLSPVLTPFLMAIILAYFFNPVVERLVRWRVPRILSVILVFSAIICIVFFLIFAIVPVLDQQLNMFLRHIPKINQWLTTVAWPWVNTHFHIQANLTFANAKTLLLKHLPASGNVLAKSLKVLTHSTGAIIAFGANVVLIPVLTFYFLWDWQKITDAIKRLLPRHSEKHVVKMVQECGEVLSSFFRGQLSVMLCLAIIYAAGLWLVGLQVGLLIGLFAGLLSIVPYLGFIAGLILASISALLQFHDWVHLMGVFMVFGVGEFAESWILIPYLVGDRLGIHPLAVIFSIMAFGQLFGFVGVLIAVPVSAVILVFLKHLRHRYLHSHTYKTK